MRTTFLLAGLGAAMLLGTARAQDDPSAHVGPPKLVPAGGCPCIGGGGSSGSSSRPAGWTYLLRGDAAPARAKGTVYRVRGKSRSMHGSVFSLAPNTTYGVFQEGVRTGEFTTGPDGQGAFVEPEQQVAPLGAIEVRDAQDGVVFRGTIPTDAPPRVRRSVRSSMGTVRTRLFVDVRVATGKSVLRIEARGLDAGRTLDLVVVRDGREVAAGSSAVDGHGRAQFVFDARTGDPLPDDAYSPLLFAGDRFSLRVDGAEVGAAHFAFHL